EAHWGSLGRSGRVRGRLVTWQGVGPRWRRVGARWGRLGSLGGRCGWMVGSVRGWWQHDGCHAPRWLSPCWGLPFVWSPFSPLSCSLAWRVVVVLGGGVGVGARVRAVTRVVVVGGGVVMVREELARCDEQSRRAWWAALPRPDPAIGLKNWMFNQVL
ncbi:hypothetical protein H0H92_013875, partial [Tricholoma furcatifolium]